MEKINYIKYGIFIGIITLGVSCTNLDEQIIDSTDITKADPDAVLQSAYNGLRAFQGQEQMFALQEVSTDILAVPTRGGDWYDNGEWNIDHNHKWTATSREVRNSWDLLLTSVYSCDLALAIATITPEKKAQALFLKAFYYYHAIDFYGQVPYREAGSNPDDFPKVWSSPEATAKIISYLEEALPNLPQKGTDPAIANKDAARFLLAKIYLNKSVFDSPGHQLGAFSAADMTKVVEYIDAITASGKTSLAPDYWDNFKPANADCPEVIFSSKNILNVVMGDVRTRWYMGAHYNQKPSGWNGFSVLGEFYDTFDPADRRILNKDASVISFFGNPMGMQIGQQFAPGGVTPLKTRKEAGEGPLVFTKAIPDDLVIPSGQLETAGVRPQKYLPDTANLDKPENDYVFFRYADAMLMKSEAIARGGAGSVGTIAAELQARQGITTPVDLTSLEGILKARGNELWAEGWRRNDLIRFGKYTTSRRTMTNTDPYRVLFPIPASALTNPNLKQNPGY